MLRTLSREEDTKYFSADRSSDRAKRLTAYSHRERRNRYNHFIDVLNNELKEQTAARSFTIKRLAREKQHWFSHSMSTTVSYFRAIYCFRRSQGNNACCCNCRALSTSSCTAFTYGCRLLCPDCEGSSFARHTRFLNFPHL
jgi:hypothetical protein